MSEMAPEQILMIAQAGSYLYGLNTPDSDTDYVVIYAEPTQVTVDNIINTRLLSCFEALL